MNLKTILITGASGLIGGHLTSMLLSREFQVRHLGRTKIEGPVPSLVWDIDQGHVQENALDGIDAIIHLAGAGVAEKRWTATRKREILESRTQSTALLYDRLKNSRHHVRVFVSASGIGYYGPSVGDQVFTESDKPGDDFLADVVRQWEAEADKIQSLNIRTVKIRTGIVLSGKGGVLKEIARSVRWGVGAPLGSGDQYMSWIHINDLCRMFIYAIENESIQGAYNGAPAWSTNREVTQAVARALRKPLWLPPVPEFILKLVLGEMADMVLMGSKVSSEKIRKAGFVFEHVTLDEAIASALRS